MAACNLELGHASESSVELRGPRCYNHLYHILSIMIPVCHDSVSASHIYTLIIYGALCQYPEVSSAL